MFLFGTSSAGMILYEVTDPLHPRLLCRISGTSAHTYTGDTITYLRPGSSTGTEVVLRSLGSASDAVVASIPRGDLLGQH